MPETRWGKNNGNKVISMFYDQKGRLSSLYSPCIIRVEIRYITKEMAYYRYMYEAYKEVPRRMKKRKKR